MWGLLGVLPLILFAPLRYTRKGVTMFEAHHKLLYTSPHVFRINKDKQVSPELATVM